MEIQNKYSIEQVAGILAVTIILLFMAFVMGYVNGQRIGKAEGIAETLKAERTHGKDE